MKDQLQAVRAGRWKLHLPLDDKYTEIHRHATRRGGLLLIDLAVDISENTNVADAHPDVVERLLALVDSARQDLGEFDRPGRRQREPGFIADPVPLRLATE